MPAIHPKFLHSAIYLYQSKVAALEGASAGASGFLVSVPSVHAGWFHLYAVTNKHVVDGGCQVLRVNTRDGQFKTIETQPSEWILAVDDDLAVRSLTLTEEFYWWAVPFEDFLTPLIMKGMTGLPIGPGDEVALIGRFVSLEGRQRNRPVVRFGNIAMDPDPDEKIHLSTGEQEAFLIECRSLSGFSGSAVLVYPSATRGNITFDRQLGPLLLGVDCAHMPTWKPVCSEKDPSTAYPDNDMWVDTNSGMAAVIPAWRLAALLVDQHLVKEREREDEDLRKPQDNSKQAK